MNTILLPLLPLLSVALLSGTARASAVSPPTFTAPTLITNVFMPFQPGAVKVYTGRSAGTDLVIVDLFLAETRSFTVGGTEVACVVLQETEFLAGRIAEVSRNYFAQGDDGVVYSFGEIVDHYADGQVVDHEGSWLVGGPSQASDAPEIASAPLPSVYMPVAPEVGASWKPDDLPPVAAEVATVLMTDAAVKVRAGKFLGVLVVDEENDLDGETEVERKWYAPHVGLVKSHGKQEKLQLVSTTLVQPAAAPAPR